MGSAPIGTTDVLDFFTLEAGEHLDRLDTIVSAAHATAPALDHVRAEVRALRGAAVMARQTPITECVVAVERLVDALATGRVPWKTAIREHLVMAIADLRQLVRGVRTWSTDLDQLARVRRDALTALAPVQRPNRAPGSASADLGPHLATELAEIATDLAAQDGADLPALRRLVPRLGAVRGMAALRDLAPLADIVDALDDRLADVARDAAPPPRSVQQIFVAGAAALRTIVPALSAGTALPTDNIAIRDFAAAINTGTPRDQRRAPIVPIARLGADDGSPSVVQPGHPRITARQRFRSEVSVLANHLRQRVADVREAAAGPTRGPAIHALRNTLEDLEALASSYAEDALAAQVAPLMPLRDTLSAEALSAVEEFAATLSADPRRQTTPVPVGTHATDITAPVTVAAPAPPPAPSVTPPPRTPASTTNAARGAELSALLQRSLAGFTALAVEPLSPPAILANETLPIDDLVYRGQAALRRATELRDEIRAAGRTPAAEELAELFALIDLARAS